MSFIGLIGRGGVPDLAEGFMQIRVEFDAFFQIGGIVVVAFGSQLTVWRAAAGLDDIGLCEAAEGIISAKHGDDALAVTPYRVANTHLRPDAAGNHIPIRMRDRRFIAAHRGGILARGNHRFLARWAVECAESVIGCFEARSDDPRPREALEIGRLWADGEVKTGRAMKASVAAHAAATAHAADHSMGALLYSMKALEACGMDPAAEFERQIRRLPEDLRDQVASGVVSRARKLSIGGCKGGGREAMDVTDANP